jgi:hypothetical protein
MREREDRTLPFAFRSEEMSLPTIRKHVLCEGPRVVCDETAVGFQHQQPDDVQPSAFASFAS